MTKNNIDEELRHRNPSVEKSPTVVPEVSIDIRREKYQSAIDDYLNGTMREGGAR